MSASRTAKRTKAARKVCRKVRVPRTKPYKKLCRPQKKLAPKKKTVAAKKKPAVAAKRPAVAGPPVVALPVTGGGPVAEPLSAAPPVTTPQSPEPTPPPGPPPTAPGLAVYSGPFGVRQAQRLLWRAGFGPKPGEAEALAQLGVVAAVRSLTRPTGAARLVGAEPTADGRPIAPLDAWSHDHLWWLDRMIRSDQPLVRAWR